MCGDEARLFCTPERVLRRHASAEVSSRTHASAASQYDVYALAARYQDVQRAYTLVRVLLEPLLVRADCVLLEPRCFAVAVASESRLVLLESRRLLWRGVVADETPRSVCAVFERWRRVWGRCCTRQRLDHHVC